MELSPEERQRIYLEEKTRLEAREQLQSSPPRKKPGKLKWVLLAILGLLILVPVLGKRDEAMQAIKTPVALKDSRYSFFHAGCPHNIVQMLAGHAAQGVHDQVYLHREALPLKLLQEGLEKLQYSDVVKRLASDSI